MSENEQTTTEPSGKEKENRGPGFVEYAKGALRNGIIVLKELYEDPLKGMEILAGKFSEQEKLHVAALLVLLQGVVGLFYLKNRLALLSRLTGQAPGVTEYGKMLLMGIVPGLALFAVCYLVDRFWAKSDKGLGTCALYTGIWSIPGSMLLLVMIFFMDSQLIVYGAGLFCFFAIASQINWTLRHVFGFSSKLALLVGPAMLLVVGYISNLVLVKI